MMRECAPAVSRSTVPRDTWQSLLRRAFGGRANMVEKAGGQSCI